MPTLVVHRIREGGSSLVSPSPPSSTPASPVAKENISNSQDTPKHLWNLNTKRLSLSVEKSSGASYRFHFMSHASKLFEDEIKAAKQALGVILYPHIESSYHEGVRRWNNDEEESTSSLSNDNNMVSTTVVRPLWLKAYKEVSACQQKRNECEKERKAVEEKLRLVTEQEQSNAAKMLEQVKLSWRQTQLKGRLQDLEQAMAKHKDTFGVDVYNALHELPQKQLELLHEKDTFLGEAYAKCQATIRGIVLDHQQRNQDAMPGVFHTLHTEQSPTIVTPTKEDKHERKVDGEESVTENSDTDDEYHEVEA